VRDKAVDPELAAWPTGLVWTSVGFGPLRNLQDHIDNHRHRSATGSDVPVAYRQLRGGGAVVCHHPSHQAYPLMRSRQLKRYALPDEYQLHSRSCGVPATTGRRDRLRRTGDAGAGTP
jgi:hypothetical protein